jgi:hydroxymethylbilane synthase
VTRGGPLRIGTRGSPLALAQARLVRAALAACFAELAAPGALETVVVRTTGDRVQDRPLAEIGGKGLFTKEIDEALLDGRIDMAVHSMKDVPTRLPDGLLIAAMLPREDPRDVLIAKGAGSIAALPEGARIGTASLRRKAQLLRLRPDLRVETLRGNVATRMAKVETGVVDATLLALAGLARLGHDPLPGVPLAVEEMLPAVGQGAVGIEARAGDARILELLQAIDHTPTSRAVACERALLEVLDGSCRTPIAALAEPDATGLRLRGLVLRPDGSEAHAVALEGDAADPVALGRAAGLDLRARIGPGFLE